MANKNNKVIQTLVLFRREGGKIVLEPIIQP